MTNKCQWCGEAATSLIFRVSDGQLTLACKHCKPTAIGSNKYQYRRKLTTTKQT